MNVSYIERGCNVTVEGHTFTADGAIVTDNYLVAYVGEHGQLRDWHGKVIGSYQILSSRPAVFFGHRSWMAERYYYMRGWVNGRTYSLRGFGKSFIATGKRIRDN